MNPDIINALGDQALKVGLPTVGVLAAAWVLRAWADAWRSRWANPNWNRKED